VGRKDKVLHKQLLGQQLPKERRPLSSGRIFTAEWIPYVPGSPVERLKMGSIAEVYWWALWFPIPHAMIGETEIGTV
jgi:hypothetical protein